MSTRKITDAIIPTLRLPARNYILYRDHEVRGLAVRVTEAGGRAFTLEYKTVTGQRRRITLGEWGATFGVAAARAKAVALRREIEAGDDPLRKKDENDKTVAGLAEVWMTQYVMVRARPRTIAEYRSILNRHILPKLANAVVANIRTRDVADLLDAIRPEHPITSNRVRAIFSVMFNYAIGLGWIAVNPINRTIAKAPEPRRPTSQAKCAHCGMPPLRNRIEALTFG